MRTVAINPNGHNSAYRRYMIYTDECTYVYSDTKRDLYSTMQGNGTYPGESGSKSFAEQFTERELAILRLICQGKSRNEVVKELFSFNSLSSSSAR